ncbi:SDR family oxidoreductase [Xenorhabdus bovienii]|uniref:SDR family NAD(P)-dependent oxidoreductase n=1 Tax=Xenorhabdus bovienii TaxID=40576 RepID=UPI0023B33B69|nr:SDR family NAD(P)-dependent oxidoreductase [Xenorhabdus bovienii]MDE9482411.1 SDR family oxidoreductase [Xenorhabdus bovienii]MDE9556287.1 SDR family oxidoreductase [Xenorhabdus bovienii]
MNKTVLVTGGAKGIGRAVVCALAAQGYHIIFTWYRSSQQAEELCAWCLHQQNIKGNVQAMQCDLADVGQLEALCSQLERDGNSFYGFVHCAGEKYDTLVATLERERIERLMQINFYSFIRLVQALLPRMSLNGSGRIVAIGSVAARQGSRGNSIYSASKSALEGFMHSAIHEVARRGITLNVVAPGFISTDMTTSYQDSVDIKRAIPAQRFGNSEEVAESVAFLLADASAYINGETLVIDGGMTRTAHLVVQRT